MSPRSTPEVDLPQSNWKWFIAALAVLFAAFQLYDPALRGTWVFDDSTLPFALSRYHDAPVANWIAGNRPVLMFSYWVDYRLLGGSPLALHAVNVLIHAANTLLVFLVVLRLLRDGRLLPGLAWRASAMIAAIFLVHPLQTESVAYIAGRSESLCAFFLLLALFVYLGQPESGVGWKRTAAVLLLFGLAILTKEHAVVFPAILLLTDYFWELRFDVLRVRRNWRLYLPVAILSVAGTLMVVRVLTTSRSAGFHLRGVTPIDYFLTENRAILEYIRLSLLPLGQSIDHAFPISRSLWQHGAGFALLGLACLVLVAFLIRKRQPLVSFGILFFLILLAPTSTIVPIADPLVERRMYLPLIGLVLAAVGLIASHRRVQFHSYAAAALILVPLAILTYQRNQLWASPRAIWLDAVASQPQKVRPYTHLAQASVEARTCDQDGPLVLRALERHRGDYQLHIAAAKIMQCQGDTASALAMLRRAAEIRPTSEAFELLGLLYGERNELDAARQALEKAARLNPRSYSAYMSLALWYRAAEDVPGAIQMYEKVLELEPNYPPALTSLNILRERLKNTSHQ